MTKELSNRNKMAATGDDAAAMDSISRAPAAQSASVNRAADSSNDDEVAEAVAENPVPKRPISNSEWWPICYLLMLLIINKQFLCLHFKQRYSLKLKYTNWDRKDLSTLFCIASIMFLTLCDQVMLVWRQQRRLWSLQIPTSMNFALICLEKWPSSFKESWQVFQHSSSIFCSHKRRCAILVCICDMFLLLFKFILHVFRYLWGLPSAGEHEQTYQS